jgi:hypothetical protein
LKKEAKTFVLCWAVCAATFTPSLADEAGRDFPKTLIFDEPGIDDEISLPTIIVAPQPGGHETDIDFELDKRLTTRLSLQINIGYTQLPRPGETRAEGWQNTNATLKFAAFANAAHEQLVSLSLIREFGESGARQIGAETISSTTAAINFGQGFASFADTPALKPFAITGSAGFLVADHGSTQQALLSASLQYSLDVFSSTPGGQNLPHFLRPFIPIVECSFALPTRGGGQRGLLAPGLIYAGEGYQVAAEALLPLTKEAGTHAGFIAQLNISLATLGLPALARPLL